MFCLAKNYHFRYPAFTLIISLPVLRKPSAATGGNMDSAVKSDGGCREDKDASSVYFMC